jgi:hypothetical protein
MQRPHGPADQPPYNSFCVAHVLLGGDHPGCQTVRVHGFDTPDDAADRANITTTYPGSMLQAPTCRAIAAKLMWTNRTGLASSVLQSRTALNNTVQNNLASKSQIFKRLTCQPANPQALAAAQTLAAADPGSHYSSHKLCHTAIPAIQADHSHEFASRLTARQGLARLHRAWLDTYVHVFDTMFGA